MKARPWMADEHAEMLQLLRETLAELEDAADHGYDSEHRGRLSGQRVNISRAIAKAESSAV